MPFAVSAEDHMESISIGIDIHLIRFGFYIEQPYKSLLALNFPLIITWIFFLQLPDTKTEYRSIRITSQHFMLDHKGDGSVVDQFLTFLIGIHQ